MPNRNRVSEHLRNYQEAGIRCHETCDVLVASDFGRDICSKRSCALSLLRIYIMNLTFDLQQLLLLVLSVKGQVDNILHALDGIISRLGLCFGFRSLLGLGSSLRLCSGLGLQSSEARPGWRRADLQGASGRYQSS